MGSIPLPALAIREPNPLEAANSIASLAGFAQRQQLGNLAIQKQQYELGATKAMNEAYKGAVTIDENGQPKFDTDALTKSLSNAGYGSQVPGILKNVTDFQQSQANLAETRQKMAGQQQDMQIKQQDMMGSVGAAIKAANYDPGFADTFLQHYEINNPGQKAQIEQFRGELQQNPGLVKRLADTWIATSPAQQKMQNEQTVANIRASGGAENRELNAALQSGAIKNESEWPAYKAKQEAQIQLNKGIAEATNPEIQAAKIHVATAESAARLQQQQSLLQPNAIDLPARNYLLTGQMPAGMRSPGMSSMIMNRAAQMALENPELANLAGNRAAYEANKKSYDNVTGTLDTLTAFENVGKKNLENFLNLAKGLPDTGQPWLNKPVREIDENIVGNQYLPAIRAAKSVALREIARITNDPKLKGVLTDSARQEVEGLVPDRATLPQIRNVANVLIQDVNNVHQAVAAQKADIGNRLGIKATPEPTHGLIYAKDPQGKLHSAPAGTALPPNWIVDKGPEQ
jgi:hypothetical protein